MPTAYVLGPFGSGQHGRDVLPYGAQHLADSGFATTYADPEATAAYRLRPLRFVVRAVQRLIGAPALEPVLQPIRLRRADLLVCFLEDNVAALAPALRVLRRGRPSVLVVCWLAETLASADRRELRRWRRRLLSFSHVVTLSSNQVPLLTGLLRLPPGHVTTVPFGVAPLGAGPITGRTVLTVGGDRARDFRTFAAAMRDDPDALIITTAQQRRALGEVPVAVTGPVSRVAYLHALGDAAIVVSPVHPVAYPSGQTSLLEAMQAGRACVATRTAAIADYVTDGVDVLLVPPHDPSALRAAVDRLRDDPDLRERLGSAAAANAARFTDAAMWAAIAAASRASTPAMTSVRP